MHQEAAAPPSVLERLGELEIFRALPPAARQALVSAGRLLRFKAGAPIFVAGEPYKGEVYILLAGEIEVRRPTGGFYWAGPGDILGLSNYLDRLPYSGTARALTPCEVLAVPAAGLQALERRSPALFNAISRYIAARIRTWAPAREVCIGRLARSVRSAMTTPLVTCPGDLSLREAFEVLRARGIGSIVVVDDDGTPRGIATRADLLAALLDRGLEPDTHTLAEIARPPRLVDADSPLWRAEEIQNRERVRHLVVVEGERPVGMLSQTDILRALVAHHSSLLERIRGVASPAALAELRHRVGEVAVEAFESNRRAVAAVRAVSETHLAIQRRCIELVVEAMKAEGRGLPPLPFAVIVMGSGGRREMLLAPDQDNGIILAEDPAAGDEAAWFETFSERLNAMLAEVGYPACRGGVMARNPRFRKSLARWCSQVAHLAAHPNRKAARWSNIVFDFDTLWGAEELTRRLRQRVLAIFAEHTRLLRFMAADDVEGRPPIGWFNRLIATTDEAGQGLIDIKRNGLRIVADAARIFALAHGVAACNTEDRLHALVRAGALEPDFADSVIAAYEHLHALLLRHQIERCRRGLPADERIDPGRLDGREREALRESMLAVKRFQDRMQEAFGP